VCGAAGAAKGNADNTTLGTTKRLINNKRQKEANKALPANHDENGHPPKTTAILITE